MKLIKIFLALITVVCSVSAVQAEDATSEKYVSTGIGAQINSCAVWMKSQQYKKDSQEEFSINAMMLTWLQGNFAGRNAYTDPRIVMPSSIKLAEFLDLYCKTDPTITVHEIANNLWPVLIKFQNQREAQNKK